MLQAQGGTSTEDIHSIVSKRAVEQSLGMRKFVRHCCADRTSTPVLMRSAASEEASLWSAPFLHICVHFTCSNLRITIDTHLFLFSIILLSKMLLHREHSLPVRCDWRNTFKRRESANSGRRNTGDSVSGGNTMTRDECFNRAEMKRGSKRTPFHRRES